LARLSGSRPDPTGPALKPSKILKLIPLRSSSLQACWSHCHIFVSTRFCGKPSGTTIVMVVYNNKDILMLAYEDLPDEDKDIINKAMVEF
jgi:hypothetical protein